MSHPPGHLRSPVAARRIGVAYLVLSVVMVPWTIWLAWTLPPEEVAHHYDLAWPGFDLMLIGGLATTGVWALRHSRYLGIAASATAALLVVDAWFDVTTAGARDRLASVGLAVLIELPLAALCLWLAVHTQDLLGARVTTPPAAVTRSDGTAADEPRTPLPPARRG